MKKLTVFMVFLAVFLTFCKMAEEKPAEPKTETAEPKTETAEPKAKITEFAPTPSPPPTPQASEEDTRPPIDFENPQLQAIFDNREEWINLFEYARDTSCRFAITDLDMDGQLEITVADIEGTGQYTYSYTFEVDKNNSSLSEIADPRPEYDSKLDIIAYNDEESSVFYDSASSIYYYIFDDYVHVTAGWIYIAKGALYIKDNTIYSRRLAQMELKGELLSDGTLEEKTTYTDADGNEITKKEYDNMENTVFANLKKMTAHIEWVTIPAGTSQREISEKLIQSYEGFKIK